LLGRSSKQTITLMYAAKDAAHNNAVILKQVMEARGVIVRLKESWQQEWKAWSQRSLAGKQYVYFWADGVYFNIRLEEEGNQRQCILVLMGATPEGTKELIAIAEGYRESEQSWKELLLDVKARGLASGPKVAVADGALGFWAALPKVFSKTREQRCWVHKTANVLNKLPKHVQSKAKAMLHEIWMAATKADAERAFNQFLETFEAKYPKATACLAKDRAELLAFYDFPAEHWVHIRTTNPIESTFATVRLRTRRTKGSGSRTACLTMVFKLAQCAERSWRKLSRDANSEASGVSHFLQKYMGVILGPVLTLVWHDRVQHLPRRHEEADDQRFRTPGQAHSHEARCSDRVRGVYPRLSPSILPELGKVVFAAWRLSDVCAGLR